MGKWGQMYTHLLDVKSTDPSPLLSGTQMGGTKGSLASGGLQPGALTSKPLTSCVIVDELQWAMQTVLPRGAFLLVGKTGNNI